MFSTCVENWKILCDMKDEREGIAGGWSTQKEKQINSKKTGNHTVTSKPSKE